MKLPIIGVDLLCVSISRAGKWTPHVCVVGHLWLGFWILVRLSSVPLCCGQSLILLVTYKALKAVQVVGLAHVVDAPLSILKAFQKAEIGYLTGRFVFQVLQIFGVILVQIHYELCQLLRRCEIIGQNGRIVVREPVSNRG